MFSDDVVDTHKIGDDVVDVGDQTTTVVILKKQNKTNKQKLNGDDVVDAGD